MIAENKELSRKIVQIERHLANHDEQIIEWRWTPKTGQGAKLYVRLLRGGTDHGKNQKKAQSTVQG